MELYSAERGWGLGESGLQQTDIPNAVTSPVDPNLIAVDFQDIIRGEKLEHGRVPYSASFLNTFA